MTASSAKTGTIGLSLALDNNYMEPIATTVVGSTAVNSIIFNDIPQTYKHLQIRMLSRESSGGFGQGYMQLNGDNGNNYATHNLNGNGATTGVGATTSTSSISIAAIPGPNQSANIFGASVIDILDYANTNKYKTTRALAGTDANGSGYIWFSSGVWMNNNAITSIKIIPDSGYSWAQYSRFSLYGVKG